MRLTPRNFLWLLRRSVIAAFDDGALAIAKGAAYSALLSFFPVIAAAATILIETRADFVAAHGLGFDLVQGYLFGKPMGIKKFARSRPLLATTAQQP